MAEQQPFGVQAKFGQTTSGASNKPSDIGPEKSLWGTETPEDYVFDKHCAEKPDTIADRFNRLNQTHRSGMRAMCL